MTFSELSLKNTCVASTVQISALYSYGQVQHGQYVKWAISKPLSLVIALQTHTLPIVKIFCDFAPYSLPHS